MLKEISVKLVTVLNNSFVQLFEPQFINKYNLNLTGEPSLSERSFFLNFETHLHENMEKTRVYEATKPALWRSG